MGIVVDLVSLFQMCVATEMRLGQSGVARDLDPAYARLHSRGHLECNIDELLAPMPGQPVGDHRFIEAVIGQRLAHPSQGRIQARLSKPRSSRQPARRLQLCVDRRALGSIHADRSNEIPRCAPKDKPHAVAIFAASTSIELNSPV